jgi:hypothetical protein
VESQRQTDEVNVTNNDKNGKIKNKNSRRERKTYVDGSHFGSHHHHHSSLSSCISALSLLAETLTFV